jgi:hypothetical protein
VVLKAINGEPMLVNLSLARTISTISLAGDDVGVIAFDHAHEVVVGSTVAQVIEAIGGPPLHFAD